MGIKESSQRRHLSWCWPIKLPCAIDPDPNYVEALAMLSNSIGTALQEFQIHFVKRLERLHDELNDDKVSWCHDVRNILQDERPGLPGNQILQDRLDNARPYIMDAPVDTLSGIWLAGPPCRNKNQLKVNSQTLD